MAIYHFFIVDCKACIDENPEQGIWISKNVTDKAFTNIAHLTRKRWEESLGCVHSDAGVITSVKVLDIDRYAKVVD